ncbi:XopV/AopV family type III secretion system effector [Ralstonia solanacearum]|uniref:XopV/AopV family type III secretion system effector n=1 Tax=Ralstonia solanacearum TaxID=305 RepID=UPI00078BC679|nr:XopV/AopV family type III secretion system effector [Ralstonia solanacearum]AMP40455.1 type III effector protein [Ralstonia solanacearum]AXV89312.1 type III effector protein [Ralstonia solanacearum]AXW08986.1 type III effector protein [Ralstonia solanacearum]AXW26776.1 type III effector protein [Ralstonia solanacearum]AXW64883.1 type III effector protein [Ralstonia solanacearum]
MLKIGRITGFAWHGGDTASAPSPPGSEQAPTGKSRAPALSGLKPAARASGDAQPSLQRTTSARMAAPDGTEHPRLERTLSGGGSLQRTPFRFNPDKYRARHGKTLTEKYGSAQPARGKHGRSAIQRDERDKLPQGGWRTCVNPTRILVTPTGIKTQADIARGGLTDGPRSLPDLIDLDRLVKEPGVFKYKWDMSRNGTLIIGNIQVQKPDGDGVLHLGHPTLVGGRRIPEARISGMLYADEAGRLTIDNDSGRFSEYNDRSKAQLEEVAALFKDNGLAVAVSWVDMQNGKVKKRPSLPLVNDPKLDW